MTARERVKEVVDAWSWSLSDHQANIYMALGCAEVLECIMHEEEASDFLAESDDPLLNGDTWRDHVNKLRRDCLCIDADEEESSWDGFNKDITALEILSGGSNES